MYNNRHTFILFYFVTNFIKYNTSVIFCNIDSLELCIHMQFIYRKINEVDRFSTLN